MKMVAERKGIVYHLPLIPVESKAFLIALGATKPSVLRLLVHSAKLTTRREVEDWT